MSGTERLIDMANDIGAFFRTQPSRPEAVAGIANHIRSFWTRPMRATLTAHLNAGGQGLDELPKEALALLAEAPAAVSTPPPGGDAG